jgi:putative ABC transport system permease protein
VPLVEREITDRAAVINRTLPAFLIKNDFVFRPIITTRAAVDQRVQHSIRPTVVALTLFGLLAALATLAIIALAVARIMRQVRPTNETALALGMRRRDRVVAHSLPYVPVAVVAMAAATALAFVFSRLAPVGEVRRVVGYAAMSLPFGVTALVLAGFFVLFALAVIASAVVTSRSVLGARRRGRPSASVARPVERAASPAVAAGIRSATTAGRGARLLTAASCVAVAALAASIVFGSNLVALVDHPQRYGWPWDVAVLTNFGYGSLNRTQAHTDLSRRNDIESYDEVGFFSAQIKGKSVPALIGGEDARAVDLPITQGRAPTTFAEVALGAQTASDLDAQVGDQLDVQFGTGPKGVRQRERVVGIAVFPSIGQNLADRTGLGHGLFTVVPPSRIASSQSGSDIDDTFVGIRLKPGANPVAVASALRARANPWDTSGQTPFVYAAPIRPPEIRNAQSIRNGPVLLAGLLGLALLIALALAIAVSVNERRRELAVLRAVGFTRSQLRQSIWWQALTTVIIGVVIGIPAGIIAGRWGWRVFAEQLGVAPAATLPVLALLVMAAVVVVGALVAAARPAYVAGHTSPAVALRSQ